MKTRLDGRVAIVTGSGNGIGRAEAEALARAGAAVVVNDIARDGAESLAERVAAAIRDNGGEAQACEADIGSFAGCEQLVTAARERYGRLDIVVNNAGMYRVGPLEDISEEEWDRVLRVNLTGTYGTIRFATPFFKEQRSGAIVNTGSGAGLGIPGQLAYASSKEGVIGLTRSVARELGHYGIRCNALRPRSGGTAMFAQAQAVLGPWTRLREALGRYAIGESWPAMVGRSVPEDIGPFVAWLCSDSAAHVNGRSFMVGGDLLGRFNEPTPEHCVQREGGWSLEAIDHVGADVVAGDLGNHFLLEGVDLKG